MKKNLTMLALASLFLISGKNAFADDRNSDSYLQLGRGAKMIARKDIRFSPGESYLSFGTFAEFCHLELMVNTEAFLINKLKEVVIPAGSEIRVAGTLYKKKPMDVVVGTDYSGEWSSLGLVTRKGTHLNMWCLSKNTGEYDKENTRLQMSIETFRRIFDPVFAIELGDAVEI